MRALILAVVILSIAAGAAWADVSLSDSVGVIRVFGDTSSWVSTCFVVGDGSWVVTTWDSITEKVGPDTNQTIRYPLFISPYTGQAYQCELKASNKELGIAVLKLAAPGLPGAALGQMSEFSKAAYGTMGQLTSGDPIGNAWPTDIYGLTVEKVAGAPKLVTDQWSAAKVFVTDIGKFKWVFLSDVNPSALIPNGSMVVHGQVVAGMYLSKLVITGGPEKVSFGRCAMSTEIARYMGDSGVDTATLYNPPKPTIVKAPDADVAFQLQAKIYSQIGGRRPAMALEPAQALVKLRPQDPQAKMALGIALLGAEKPEDALKSFDEAMKLDPKLPTLRTNRALALIALKKTTEAESELKQAVAEAPQDVRPVLALADFYLGDEKMLDKALTYAQKATEMAPNSAAAQLLVGKVEKSQKDYKAAITSIGEALKMAPDWGDAWYALGATCEEGGDKASAEKAYRKLLEKQPNMPSSYITLASFLADQGQKDEALTILGKLRDMKPSKDVLDTVQALEDKINGKKADK